LNSLLFVTVHNSLKILHTCSQHSTFFILFQQLQDFNLLRELEVTDKYLSSVNISIYSFLRHLDDRLLTWAIIAAYQGFLVIPAVLLLMVIQYTSIEAFIFGWRKETKIYDAVLSDEPSETRQKSQCNLYKSHSIIMDCSSDSMVHQ
jgi:hypothetical protein